MLVTALLIGFLGSLHCAGMCSPLAIAATNLSGPAFINRLVYNGGRIMSYAIQGVCAAALGSLFEFTGLQNILSITLGVILIIAGFAGITRIHVPFLTTGIQKLTTAIKVLLSRFIQQKTKTALILTGMLNGLLPCGLTYMALSYCITLVKPQDGFIFMLVFGLGTLPVMLGFTSLIQTILTYFNISFRKITTITMVMMGLLLVSRTLYSHATQHPVDKDGITVCR